MADFTSQIIRKAGTWTGAFAQCVLTYEERFLRRKVIKTAEEPLLQITGDLVQLAWHIGNRHTPCQLEPDRLLIQSDPVIGHMLEHLGATVTSINAQFTPEGGAYGHGRTHSHDHGATAHDH